MENKIALIMGVISQSAQAPAEQVIRQIIEEAVAEEREACAWLADHWPAKGFVDETDACAEIAEGIRARSKHANAVDDGPNADGERGA